MRAFVFPDEAVLVPGIRPAIFPLRLFGIGLEGKKLAFGVGFERGLVPDQRANIVEVSLGGRFFFKLDLAPLFDELGGGKGGGHGVIFRLICFYFTSACFLCCPFSAILAHLRRWPGCSFVKRGADTSCL